MQRISAKAGNGHFLCNVGRLLFAPSFLSLSAPAPHVESPWSSGADFRFASAGKVAIALLLAVLAVPASPALADVQHVYDEASRLVETVAPNGDSAQYEYDDAGNILSITRRTGSELAIVQFLPSSGPIGATVTIAGNGFSPTASQNTVTFNGASAAVASASANQLVVVVPSSATTGSISVTSPNGSATSAHIFTVVAGNATPTITDFNPKIGAPGTAFAITGANFDSVLTNDKVALGLGVAGIVPAASSPPTSLGATVPADTGSGRITVTTPIGAATSAANFVVVPSYGLSQIANPTDVVAQARLSIDGPTQSLSIPNSKAGVLLFDASAGSVLTLDIPTWTAGVQYTYRVFTPRNVLLVHGAVSSLGTVSSPMSIHLPLLPLTGTYSVYFSQGSGAVNLSAALLGAKALALDGPSLNQSFSSSWKTVQFSFNTNVGQNAGLGISNLVLAQTTSVIATVYSPDGSILALNALPSYCTTTNGGCSYSLSSLSFAGAAPLSLTGTYRVVVVPNAASTGSFTATLSSDVTGTLTPGSAFNVNLSRVGQNGRPTFNGTAGDNFNVALSAVNLTGSTYVSAYALKPDGSVLTQANFNNNQLGILTLPPLPVSGNYSLFLDLPNTATGGMTVLLAPDAAATLALDGTPSNVAITQTGQKATLRFNGTAGQNLGFAISALTLSLGGSVAVVKVYAPDGSLFVSGGSCVVGTGCSLNLTNLPATGVYRAAVTPANSANSVPNGATGSFTATLSSDVATTLTSGTGFNLNLSRPGQNGRLSFSGAAGDSLDIAFTNVAIVGSSSQVSVSVYKPDGSVLTSTALNTGTSTYLSLPTLPVAGTYSVFVDPPYAATASMDVLLSADALATLALGGAPSNISITQTGQKASLTFAGTAGQNLGLGISGLTLTPNSSTIASVTVYKPDNTVLVVVTCYVANGGCGINLANLPATGAYRVVVVPLNGATGSFTATLSSDVVSTLTSGAPYDLNLPRAGQNARLTFSGTVGDNRGLTLSAVNLVGTGSAAGGVATVYMPDGSFFATNPISNGQLMVLSLPTLPTTGTYTVFIDPPYAVTASMSVLLTADVTATLALDGTPTNVSIAQTGQKASLTFAGTAGQNLGLGISGLTLTPSSSTSATVTTYRPDGTALLSVGCLVANGGCGMNLVNLPVTGNYRVVVTPVSGATASFTATLSSDASAVLTAGTAYNLSLARAGQNARLAFSGIVGDNRGLTLSSVNFVGMGNTFAGLATVYKPDGSTLANNSFSNGQLMVLSLPTLPTTGTYTVFIDPPYAVTASMSVLLTADVTATLALDGTPTNVSIAQTGQKASLTFAGTAGQNLGLGISGLTLTPSSSTTANVTIYKPDNTVLMGVTCSVSTGGCGMNLVNLPVTGSYSVVVTPGSGATGNFTATLSSDLTGALTAGTAYGLNTTRAGQNARLTFGVTAGQSRTLTFSSMATIPANQLVMFGVYKPDGSLFTYSTPSTASSTLTLNSPPVTGTYTLLIDPYYASTVTVSIVLSP